MFALVADDDDDVMVQAALPMERRNHTLLYR